VDAFTEAVIGLLSGAFGAGATWAALNAKVNTIVTAVAKQGEAIEDHTKELRARELDDVRLTARIKAVEADVNERAMAGDKLERKFDAATKFQNETLIGIASRVGVRVSREFPAADRGTDPPSLPEMRRRLPSMKEE
jgi:hypothetical protein